MTNHSTSAAHVRQVIKHLIPTIDNDEDSLQSECDSNGPSNTRGTFTSNSYEKKDVTINANAAHQVSTAPYFIANNLIHHDNINSSKNDVDDRAKKKCVANSNNILTPLPLA